MTEAAPLARYRDAPVAPALLFGVLAATDVELALLESSAIPLLSRDSLRLVLGLFVLVGIPALLGFLLLAEALRLPRAVRRLPTLPATASILLLGLGVVAATAAIRGSVPAEVTARRHLALAVFLVLLLLEGRPQRPARALFLLVGAAAALLLGVGTSLVLGGLVLAQRVVVADNVQIVEPPHTNKTLLIGVDGLCWETLQRWRDRGSNEDLHWFEKRAYIGPLKTLTPTDSPRIWTSIATGTRPEEHGVLGFTAWEAKGLRHAFVEIPAAEGALFWLGASERLGLVHERPVSSLDMRRPPLWEIVGTPERPVDVVAWWATWPALPLHGTLVSDKFYFWRDRARSLEAEDEPPAPTKGLTYPPEEELRLASLRVAPESMTLEQIRSFIHVSEDEAREMTQRRYRHHDVLSELPLAFTMDETHYAISEELLKDAAPLLAALYFRGVDIVSHSAMRYSGLYSSAGATSEESMRYGELVSQYYSYTFSRLRRLIEAAGQDAFVLLVSDHGFEPIEDGDFNHPHAPDGVIIALGAGKGSPAPVFNPSIYDIAPTVLWLMGYPVAKDMPGRPLRELFPDVAAAIQRCESYGVRKPISGARGGADTESDEEMMELLRTLGYID